MKDYSGKNLSPRMNRWLLVVNIILLICSVWLVVANIQHNEISSAVCMGIVGVVALFNGILAWLRLLGKKI